MIALLLAHLVFAVALPLLVARWGRAVFAVAALPPLAVFGWAVVNAPQALSGSPPTDTVAWAPLLGLEFVLRLDALSLAMTLLVSGVGAVVLLYYTCYAAHEREGTGRNVALMLVFAFAMLGLVLADEVFGFYLFWELTTLCSFGLIGGAGVTATQRRAALQALLTTTLGGFALLFGLILLAEDVGSFRISVIVAEHPTGRAVGVALALILLGSLTKSAQLPFHPWLPAAMVAPTPVTAYLHAAAMVQAGVYLVARVAAGFAGHPLFAFVVAAGLASMLVGGYRALRQQDLKMLLAHGTVSQLGFLLVLFGSASRTAAMAGMVMLLAHGLFKSTLFLVVGVIDKIAGTRDIRELSGVGRRMPALALTAALAAASMAGLPPLLGFAGKEAAFEAFSSGGGAPGVAVLVGIVAGSIFTVAYTGRLLWGAFAVRPEAGGAPERTPSGWFVAITAVPAAAGLLLGPTVGALAPLVTRHADSLPADTHYELALWHGIGFPVVLSAVTLAGGYLLYRAFTPTPSWGRLLPCWADAQHAYERAVHGTDAFARWLTGRTQVGSLPVYIGVILLSVVLVPGATFLLVSEAQPHALWWDRWLQVPLALVVIVATLGVLAARRRLTAVLVIGVAGYGLGALFLVHGAPDVALAQVLVETLTLIVFVFVLRRLPAEFTEEPSEGQRGRLARLLKAAIAVTAGAFVAAGAYAFSGMRTGPPTASRQYLERSPEDTGATNVVNAVLVDFRALDTIGEVTVLVIAVTGAAGLILLVQRAVGRIDDRASETGFGPHGPDHVVDEESEIERGPDDRT